MMDNRISMVTLGVQDLKRAADFYTKLGFRPSDKRSEGIMFFELDGTWLGLFPANELAKDAAVALQDSPETNTVALAHNLKSKEEVDALMRHAESCGATITKPAQDTFWGGYSGYFRDPEGFLWELAWNPHFWVGP